MSGASALCVLIACVRAQSLPDERVIREAVQTAWDAAARFPDLESVSISWRVEDRTIGTPEEWSRLIAEVPGHPDHPDRWTLEIYKRRRAGDFLTDSVRFRLQARSIDFWRLGSDLRPANLPDVELYNDRASARDAAWSLTNHSLRVTGSEGPSQPGDHHGQSFRSAFYDISHMLGGGVWLRAIHPFEADPVIVRGDRWEHRVYRLEGSTRRYGLVREGRWDAELGQPITETGFSLVGPDLSIRGTTVKYLDQRIDPVLGRLVAHRVEHVDPDGMLSKVLVYLGARAEPKGSLDAAIKVPSAGASDPWRGTPTYTMVVDERAGQTLARPVDGPTVVHPPMTDHSLAGWLRIAGWLVAGSLAVALGTLIVHRRWGH